MTPILPNKTETISGPKNHSEIESLMKFSALVGRPISPVSRDQDALIVPESGIPYVIVPNKYTVQDLEHLLPQPTRKKGIVDVTTTESFIAYVNKHGCPGFSMIYANVNHSISQCRIAAVLDDHGENMAGWKDHLCLFDPEQSVEWKRWIAKDKVVMTQSVFATWLEDNLSDVASVPGMPSGTDMLTLALAFEANAEKRLRSRINLQSGGVRFEFVEDEDKDTRASMEVFQRFTLGLPVFESSVDAYPIEARLKYREKDGKVNFWYELIRPDRVFKTAVLSSLEKIKQDTGLLVIYGKY